MIYESKEQIIINDKRKGRGKKIEIETRIITTKRSVRMTKETRSKQSSFDGRMFLALRIISVLE